MLFIFYICSATERERETSGDNHRVISVVVLAALLFSFKTNKNVKVLISSKSRKGWLLPVQILSSLFFQSTSWNPLSGLIYLQESILLVKHVISATWVPVKRLKFLYVSLNNIAVILNRQKRLKEVLTIEDSGSVSVLHQFPQYFILWFCNLFSTL